MGEVTFIEALGVFVVSAAAIVAVARPARMPTIVSYIVAGLLIGPVTGIVAPAEEPRGALETIGEMGIVLLMFLVGLELSLERIRHVGKVALAAGIGQVVFTAAGGFILCMVLGFEWVEAVFIATALTFSSTVVVVKLLDQKGHLTSLYGRIAVGIFLVQDLVVVIVLTFLAGLGTREAMEPRAIAASLATAFAGMAGLLVLALVAARYLLPRPLGWAARAPRVQFIWSLAWCFGYVVAAGLLDLSAEIGAFLAGLSIAQLGSAAELRRRTHPLMSFFIVIFFVSLGARMDVADAAAHWLPAIVLSLFVLIGNPAIFMWIISRYGYSERTGFLTSVTVAQISEFSFIFAALGVSTGLIDESILALIAVVGLITIAVSAYMILYNEGLYGLVARTGVLRIFGAGEHRDEEPEAEELRDHIVVVGMNGLGRRLATALHRRGETVLAIDRDARKLADLPCRAMIGDIDYESTLQDAGLPGARLALSVLRIESANKLFTFRCKELGVPVGVYAFDRPTFEELELVGPDCLVESKRESGLRMADELERLGEGDR